MMDNAAKWTEEMASEFIFSACYSLPKSFSLASDCMHDLNISTSPEPTLYSIMCGSTAELYIRPLNTCIGDFDILVCNTNELAFSGDVPVLPSDMSGLADTIMFSKIEPYHEYPGFVRLRLVCKMSYNWKYKKYASHYYTPHLRFYMALNMADLATTYYDPIRSKMGKNSLPNIVCGPAIKSQHSNTYIGSDTVRGFFCPQWPSEAKTWPIRPRKYGWPTINTISEVMQNGCHVVYVQHRACRNDDKQWRLSFSFAELILLQSWSKIQQIVYHLLRFFAKKELIQKDCSKEEEVLCPYHLKTLMLWTCEEMPPEWWNSSSVISICCELLKILSDWLKRRNCPNYFIPEANLFHEPLSSTMLDKTEIRLNEFHNSGILCHWFVENYILPVIRRPLFDSLNLTNDFMDHVLPFFEYLKKELEIASLNLLFSSSFTNSKKIFLFVVEWVFSSGLRQSLNFLQNRTSYQLEKVSRETCLPTTKKVLCFKYYDILLYILYTAFGLHYGQLCWDGSLFVEFVSAISMQPKIIRSQYHNFPKAYTAHSNHFQFLRVQDLMKNLTGSNSHSEFQLLALMSKQFLRKALEYDGSESNGIAPAALAYLAALYFATSEYQQVMRFCLAILVDQDSRNDKESLNAGCLLFIDDVARIVGFCVLQKKITNNLHYINKRLYLDLRLSPKVFAYYLTLSSAERFSKSFDFDHDLPHSAFPMDEYLKALLKRKCIAVMKSGSHFNATRRIVYRRTDSFKEIKSTFVNPLMVKETVIDVLVELALENMTSFYNVIRKDFGIQFNTVDCYRALYLYKCRQYDTVLRLCERIRREPDLHSDLKEFAFANVLLLPPLDSFFDRDIQSLIGFHTLLYHFVFYIVPQLNDEVHNYWQTVDPTLQEMMANLIHLNIDERTEILLKRYSVTMDYVLGRHFLARYLKVRCCIDCNLPYAEALHEFAAQRISHPFEHIIRRFLLQKLRIINTRSTEKSNFLEAPF